MRLNHLIEEFLDFLSVFYSELVEDSYENGLVAFQIPVLVNASSDNTCCEDTLDLAGEQEEQVVHQVNLSRVVVVLGEVEGQEVFSYKF